MRTLSFLLPILFLAPSVHSEGVGDWRGPSGLDRIRGVQTLLSSPSGLYTLGGPALRRLPPGKTRWEILHLAKGRNLYRIAVDDSGRVLASWEGEKVFHLLTPRTKGHKTFPKPVRAQGQKGYYSLDGLYFSKDGACAIVTMQEEAGNQSWILSAYRYRLDGKSGPEQLFRQAGYKLYVSGRAAVFAVPKDPKTPCNHNGCWPIASILAYEITPTGVVKRTLLSGERDNLSSIRGVGSVGEEGLAFVVSEKPEARGLLTWRFGEAANYRGLSLGPTGDPERAWWTRTGELVEFWMKGAEFEEKLEVKRRLPGGGVRSVTLGPLPPGDPDVSPDPKIHSIRERKNGDLLVHWGDYLVLLSAGKPPRHLNIEPMLGRMDEWASADIYAPAQESIWLGVEVGAGRDFVRLGLDEAEKRAEPF